MDRGAARSRKQEKRGLENAIKPSESPRARARPPQDSQETQAGPSTSTTQTPREAPTSRFKPRIIDNTDPARFRPKAIRDSAALIWSQAEFPLPPPTESLEKVTRVDLTGSDCTDVSWLKGTKVTWLNLKGCKIESGWDAVGSLKDLTGEFTDHPASSCLLHARVYADRSKVLNISETGLQSLPAPLSELRNLKALVAMGNPWTELDSDVMENWDQLNSLSTSIGNASVVTQLTLISRFSLAKPHANARRPQWTSTYLQAFLFTLSSTCGIWSSGPHRSAPSQRCQTQQFGAPRAATPPLGNLGNRRSASLRAHIDHSKW